MTNYKEEGFAGTCWQRCKQIVIHNELDVLPSFEFIEEKAIRNGETVKMSAGTITVPLNPADEFDILDPATSLPTGLKGTQGQIQMLLTCFYYAQAKKRDEYEANFVRETPSEIVYDETGETSTTEEV